MSNIIGVTVGTPTPQPDWNQTNPNRADYIKNKPFVANALIGKAEGNLLAIKDVSPVQHEMSVKLSNEILVGEDLCDLSTDVSTDLTSTGYYTVASVESVEDCATITFTTGAYVQSYETLSDVGWELSKGDVVYYDADEYMLYYTTGGGASVDGAVLKKYGKNLFNYDASYRSGIFYKQEDGRFRFERVNGSYTSYKSSFDIPSGNYFTLSFKGLDVSHISSLVNGSFMQIQIYFSDGSDPSYPDFRKNNIDAEGNISVTKKYDHPVDGVRFIYPNGIVDGEYITFDSFQIEIGSAATEHEEYKEPIPYTADENGIVKGIVGKGEGMTLFAEDGITIHAEYNRDLNKAFAEIYQAIATMGAAAMVIPEEV